MTATLDVRIKDQSGEFALDVDTAVPSSGVTGVVGHSGAGKSSLLACLAGIRRPLQGRIALDGRVLLDTDRGVCVPPERRRFGVVLQRPSLFPHLSVEDNLLYGARCRGRPVQAARVGQLMRALALKPLMTRAPSTLSGGEAQRVAVARAVLCEPDMLLLDEPLSAVDVQARAAVMDQLKQVCADSGVSAIFVSHQIAEVAQLAERIMVLSAGRVTQALAITELASGRLHEFGFPTLNLIEGRLSQVEDQSVLTTPSGWAFQVLPVQQRAIAETARVVINARELTLSRTPPSSSSNDNSVEANITQVSDHGKGRTLVHLKVKDIQLAAEVSEYAATRLDVQSMGSVHVSFAAPRCAVRGSALSTGAVAG
ncbi:MAG: molybdenum ABC transporter ATP-binding protein [Pseudomonadota bacterium]